MTTDALVCRFAADGNVLGLCRGPVDRYLVLTSRRSGEVLDRMPVCEAHALAQAVPDVDEVTARYTVQPIIPVDIGQALLALTGPGSRFNRGDQFRLQVAAAQLVEAPRHVGDGDLVVALKALRDYASEVLDILVCTVQVERCVDDEWRTIVHESARSVHWAGPAHLLAADVAARLQLADTGPAQWRVCVYAGDRVDPARLLATLDGSSRTIDTVPPA